VNRIGPDFERLGKADRQAGQDTRLSDHSWDDLSRVARSLDHADLFLRLNPVHSETSDEVERAVEAGVRVLMLPYFRTAEEVEIFCRFVRGRARIVILLETAAAVLRIRDVLAVRGIDEVMLGLNDLRLQFGVASHFEVLVSPVVDMVAAEVHRAGLPLAVGGVARKDQSLPIPPPLVHAQYPRLGASGAWLSRSFFHGVGPDSDMRQAVCDLREDLTAWSHAPAQDLQRARTELAERARHLAAQRRGPP
jgi:hypothetical protein